MKLKDIKNILENIDRHKPYLHVAIKSDKPEHSAITLGKVRYNELENDKPHASVISLFGEYEFDKIALYWGEIFVFLKPTNKQELLRKGHAFWTLNPHFPESKKQGERVLKEILPLKQTYSEPLPVFMTDELKDEFECGNCTPIDKEPKPIYLGGVLFNPIQVIELTTKPSHKVIKVAVKDIKRWYARNLTRSRDGHEIFLELNDGTNYVLDYYGNYQKLVDASNKRV